MKEQRLISAERFFSVQRLHNILMDWGAQVRVYGDSTPEGWGWPSQSVDPRQMAKSTDGSGLTMPEAACYKLKKLQSDIETTARLIKALPLAPRYALAYKYVHQMAHEDIALQLGLTPRCTYETMARGRKAVRLGLIALRQNVLVRVDKSFHGA